MEGLASPRIIPIQASCRQHYTAFLPTFSLQLRKSLKKGQVWMMNRPKSLDAIAASIQPSEASTTGHIDNKQPSKEELVKKLKSRKIDVYLISGGFRQMINPVASILSIPEENIFANQLLFGSSGEFLGFDANEPTSRSGGKATAVQQIRKVKGYKALVMIGDGATDLEARKPGGANLFICYGGVQLREPVVANANWLVFNLTDLINALE